MTEHVYGESVKDFAEKERVELHPAMDAWMQGDRFGEVVKLGRKYVHVLMNHSGRKLEVVPQNLRKLTDELAAVIESSSGSLRVAPEAKVFSVQGQRISTRSSKPWKRKLAKKLARKMAENGS